MAARTRRISIDDNTRAKIQATQLINRLTKHALEDLELSTTQVRAIEILLKKVLPDLQAIEVDVDGGLDIGVREVHVSGTSTKDS